MNIEIREYKNEDFNTVVNQYEKMPNFFTKRALGIIKDNLKSIGNKNEEYYCLIAEIEKKVVGNLIFNKDITGDLVYEFKWLSTDCSMRYRPYVFKKLMEAGEEFLKNKARLFILYTSNTDNEKNTQSMFLKLGYTKVAVLPDFWDDGDDRVIFMKKNPLYIHKQEVNMEEELKILLQKQDKQGIKNYIYTIHEQFSKNQQKEIKIPLGAGIYGYSMLMDTLGINDSGSPVQNLIEGQSPIVFTNYYKSDLPNLYLVRKEKFDELDNDSMNCELVFKKDLL